MCKGKKINAPIILNMRQGIFLCSFILNNPQTGLPFIKATFPV